MSVNIDKTKTMTISSTSKEAGSSLNLLAKEDPIDTVRSYKFLGVKIDDGLRFTNHINILVKKCKKRVSIIKSMA